MENQMQKNMEDEIETGTMPAFMGIKASQK